MNQSFKPILDQIKATLANKDEIRQTLTENLQLTKTLVQSTAKEIYAQTKDSKIVSQYLIPALESDKAEQALKRLDETLAAHPVLKNAQPVLKKVGEYRMALIKEMGSQKDGAAAASESDHTDAAAETKAPGPTKIPRPKRAKPILEKSADKSTEKPEETH